jgi:hypothetical protein
MNWVQVQMDIRNDVMVQNYVRIGRTIQRVSPIKGLSKPKVSVTSK